jgi:hypothetical protein
MRRAIPVDVKLIPRDDHLQAKPERRHERRHNGVLRIPLR